ncbi:MAG TPA: hypothetical protein VFN56_02100 [Candidatus Saccharimonadales bacterium]|nr:hypothetical protein [Candidatus Saccharimonadales bacterium]
MWDISDALELKWTASVEVMLAEGVDYLWHDIFVIMDQALKKRAPVYTTRRHEPRLTTTFGVEDMQFDDAQLHSVDLVKRALASANVQWLEVACLKITPNEELMEEIDQLRVFGNLDQTAKILPIVKPETD